MAYLHLKPPFRAEHLGSLKRPLSLLEKRKLYDEKKISLDELRLEEDEAIQGIIKVQREVGIKSITDGEFRRHMFFDGVFDNMDGMTYIPIVPFEMFMDYVPDLPAFKAYSDFRGAASYICAGKLKRTKPFYIPQFEALKRFTTPDEHPHIKITMCAPEWFHLRHGHFAYKKEVYANDDEYFADIVVAYQEEIKALYEAGCRMFQFLLSPSSPLELMPNRKHPIR
ncbi:UROD/MetE-like superfamily protein [Abortiporus biennis]